MTKNSLFLNIMDTDSKILLNSRSEIDRLDQLHDLLTVEELASLLKVPKSWIYEHTRRRGAECLPHIKLGKYLRFLESDVREFLESRSRHHRG